MPPASVARRALALLTAATLAAIPAVVTAQHDGHGGGPITHGVSVRQFGTVIFPTSGTVAARAPFLEGIALLHNFHYDAAAADFRRAEAEDGAFAPAYWGEALSFSAMLWGYESLDSSRAVLARLGPTPTARLARARTPGERAFGDVVEAFYANGSDLERAAGAAGAARRWVASAPREQEPLAFAALFVMTQGYRTPGPARDTLLVEAAGYAQRLFGRNPDHPGAAHYLIHAWDRPGAAAHGLPAARAYDRIAPDAEHALHMPSHIYYQIGMWPDMARSNERAWSASRAPDGAGHSARGSAHVLEWLQYAYLQQGRWRAARALVDTARRLWGGEREFATAPDEAHAATVLAFRYGADTGDWSLWPAAADSGGAAADGVRGPNGAPASLRAQGMGLIRAYHEAVGALLARGDTTLARALATRLVARATAAGVHGQIGGMGSAAVQGMAAQLDGLVAEWRGDRAGAIAAYERAVALAPGGGPSIPSTLGNRELLAAAQLASADAPAARASYEAALAAYPRRSSLLLGVARAAAGDAMGRARAYAALQANWASADADLPALTEVRLGAGTTAASPPRR